MVGAEALKQIFDGHEKACYTLFTQMKKVKIIDYRRSELKMSEKMQKRNCNIWEKHMFFAEKSRNTGWHFI